MPKNSTGCVRRRERPFDQPATARIKRNKLKMTLSDFVLYPLTHRVVTESWYESIMRLAAAAPQPVLAPVKAKRARKGAVN
jgi:hypothetical protein